MLRRQEQSPKCFSRPGVWGSTMWVQGAQLLIRTGEKGFPLGHTIVVPRNRSILVSVHQDRWAEYLQEQPGCCQLRRPQCAQSWQMQQRVPMTLPEVSGFIPSASPETEVEKPRVSVPWKSAFPHQGRVTWPRLPNSFLIIVTRKQLISVRHTKVNKLMKLCRRPEGTA